MDFVELGTASVWLERLTEVRRTSSEILPYPERLAFDLRIQVWRGVGYREWHEITIRPDRFETSEGELSAVESWKVIRYEVTGWAWIHEYSRSSGAVR